MDVRVPIFEQSKKFEFQVQSAVASYASFQRGIIQNPNEPGFKLLDEDKKQWLITCRKLRAEISKTLKALDEHTVMVKNFIKCPDVPQKKK